MISSRRLRALIGERLTDAHEALECYIANVRCAYSYQEERYVADAEAARVRTLEAMRACVAEHDAKQAKPAVTPDSTSPGNPGVIESR